MKKFFQVFLLTLFLCFSSTYVHSHELHTQFVHDEIYHDVAEYIVPLSTDNTEERTIKVWIQNYSLQDGSVTVFNEDHQTSVHNYWAQYGVNIVFEELPVERLSIADLMFVYPSQDAIDGMLEVKRKFTVRPNSQTAPEDIVMYNSYVVNTGNSEHQYGGMTSFKVHAFLQNYNVTDEWKVLIFNHELGHTAFKFKHKGDKENLMHKNTGVQALLNKKQIQKINKRFES